MGVKELYTFLRTQGVPFEQHRPSYYVNSIIAVDAYSLFFRLFYAGKKISLPHHQSTSIALLEAFLNKWPKSTTLIFIFDPPIKSDLKMGTIQKRRECEQAIQDEIKQLDISIAQSPFNPLPLARKDALMKRSKETFPIVCKEMRYLLNDKGYRIIIAKDEAEYTACEMVSKGTANYVYSNDSDCLALGCPAVIFDENAGVLKMYRQETILQHLKLTKDQFRDFCILLGNDYNGRIFAPEEAYNAITHYGSIDNISGLQSSLIAEVKKQYTI